jgi:hypothetical protein
MKLCVEEAPISSPMQHKFAAVGHKNLRNKGDQTAYFDAIWSLSSQRPSVLDVSLEFSEQGAFPLLPYRQILLWAKTNQLF